MKKSNRARAALIAGTAALVALSLGGCATVKGVGRDITSVGQAGSDAIHDR